MTKIKIRKANKLEQVIKTIRLACRCIEAARYQGCVLIELDFGEGGTMNGSKVNLKGTENNLKSLLEQNNGEGLTEIAEITILNKNRYSGIR